MPSFEAAGVQLFGCSTEQSDECDEIQISFMTGDKCCSGHENRLVHGDKKFVKNSFLEVEGRVLQNCSN